MSKSRESEAVRDMRAAAEWHREFQQVNGDAPNSILFTLMGSLYVESLYSIPGMGGLLVQAIKIQDNTLVEALVVLYSMISVVGLLLGDILMAIFDPRISFTGKEGAR